ncbi:MAG: trypsin-like serine protease [Pseudomonadota bacterium]
MIRRSLVAAMTAYLGITGFSYVQAQAQALNGLAVLDEIGIELPSLTLGGKPGAGSSPLPGGIDVGNDSCRWAHDMECDDIRFNGTGACPEGTDASDCRALAIGGDNSCTWAYDNECDEPHIGLGVCTSGTDTADCSAAAHLRNRSNSCATAFNNICEEAGQGGNGQCAERTDTVDCFGRETVAGMRDHYFGHDERVLVDSHALPWRTIGQLEFADGSCTATLVAADVVLTAAHCFLTEGGPDRPQAFYAGLDGQTYVEVAGIVDYYMNPRYDDDIDPPAGQGNGEDWGFARLDRPLGDTLGFLPVVVPQSDVQGQADKDQALFMVDQGGYSWDTGDRLSAHLGCPVTEFLPDNSMFHECDTTLGDSGSPFLLDQGGGNFAVIAVESRYLRIPGQALAAHLAVDSRAFADALNEFIAGRLSTAPPGGRKAAELPGDGS